MGGGRLHDEDTLIRAQSLQGTEGVEEDIALDPAGATEAGQGRPGA